MHDEYIAVKVVLRGCGEKRKMKGVFVFVIAGIVMSLLLIGADSAFQCSTLTTDLAPCLPFLVGNDAQPTPGCCNGLKSLNAATTTTPDRQAACNCIKSAGRSYGINFSKAAKLPGLCGVNVGVPISASTDCSK
eukprot:Gb_41633 [translate_table: standard]